jgi:hypothetical protein
MTTINRMSLTKRIAQEIQGNHRDKRIEMEAGLYHEVGEWRVKKDNRILPDATLVLVDKMPKGVRVLARSDVFEEVKAFVRREVGSGAYVEKMSKFEAMAFS